MGAVHFKYNMIATKKDNNHKLRSQKESMCITYFFYLFIYFRYI